MTCVKSNPVPAMIRVGCSLWHFGQLIRMLLVLLVITSYAGSVTASEIIRLIAYTNTATYVCRMVLECH